MTNCQPLYTPVRSKPMHVAVFGSGSGTVLEALIEGQDLYSIQAIVTDRHCRCIDIGEQNSIPTIYHSYKKHAGSKVSFEKKILNSLKAFDIDIIFLAGYMRLVQAPLLTAFPNRILNVHPADLTIRDEKGHRKYVGIDALTDALKNGETSTRSTVFIVDKGIDTGKIVTLGPVIPYTQGEPVTDERIERHLELHKPLSDWVASVQALNLVAEGRVNLNEEGAFICAESSPLLTSNQ